MVRLRRVIGSYKRPSLSFVEFKIIPPLLFYLLDLITNNYISARRSMINKILWIDSRMRRKTPLNTGGEA